MKILFSWLKEFLDTNADISQIEKTLTLSGLEVEKVYPSEFSFSGVVVGEIIKVSPHPEAEKLSVALVSDGKEEFQVVCGAPNCREGLLTAFAKVGAVLADPASKQVRKIKKAKLRGVESFGMLASEKELGIFETHEGIMELPMQTPVGMPLDSLLGDVVFEISLTPNLGHAMSVYGVARELSSLLPSSTLKHPKIPKLPDQGAPIEEKIRVSVEDPDNCYEYNCIALENAAIGPSPKWLATRLESSGIRSINNVVDVTNYVMLELGQPLHAFDYDQIVGKELIIRKSQEGEGILTLDNVDRKLPKQTLVIADKKGPVAVAGIMGGLKSSVSDNTKNIIIESANFNPASIRRSSKALHLRSDSSARFERSIDPKLPQKALAYAADLMEKLTKGKISRGHIHKSTQEFPEKILICRPERIAQILGIHLSIGEIENIFSSLQMRTQMENTYLKVTVPSFRNDIQLEIDLIEEVARVYGYNNIPKAAPKLRLGDLLPHPMHVFQKKVRHYLLEEGLQEFITCDLISPKESGIVEKAFSHLDSMAVIHPSSVDQSVLRISLAPSMLNSLKINFDQTNFDVSAFEIGKIHFKAEDKPLEKESLGILLCGERAPRHFDRKALKMDFLQLKGIIENLFSKLHINSAKFLKDQNLLFHPQKQAKICIGGQQIGWLGELHPNIMDYWDMDKRVYFAELDMEALLQLNEKTIKMSPLPVFPGSERDWTVPLPKKEPVGKILELAEAMPSSLLKSCKLIDLYESEKQPDQKNATFRFFYRSDKKTVQQQAVEKEHERIVHHIAKELKKL
ncbi:MAG: phenylalanine--tRNA ligase subunit beta [Simkaniaceae bacterium]